ncbi:MAG: LTA synthase family protein [Bacteroidales bacterium]|nr:LTA synthase family protein [Bacteroidales bacterium]
MLSRINIFLHQNSGTYIRNIFQSLLLLFCLRIVFFWELFFRLHIGFEKILIVLSGFFYYDLLLVSSIAVITAIPYCIIEHFFPKFNRVVFQSSLALYALVSAFLAEYFCYTNRPLDQVIFVYTPQEIVTAVTASTNVSFVFVIFVIINLLVWFATYWYKDKLPIPKKITFVVFLVCLLAFLIFRYKNIVRSEKGYVRSNDFYLAVNQPSYSYIKINDFYMSDDENSSFEELDQATKWWWSQRYQHVFEDYLFPFEHRNNYKDVLGQFFNKTQNGVKPNFVFIIVESFGRKLTVEEPKHSFTPFIDSLAGKSLFWSNCISSTERTFGVLPAIFASVPQGVRGFASRRELIPNHTSLLREATDNGYKTSFFYGGCASFTGQENFLNENKVSFIMQTTLDETDSDYLLKKEHYRWGLDDKEMFLQAVQHKKDDKDAPFVDVYLTLSSHEPFSFSGIEQYEQKVLQQCADEESEEADIIRENKNIYASFLYVDDAVRALMEYYKTRSDYENTVFVITGDHRMGPVNDGKNPIRKYNVPLIIYSPLLKESRSMQGVVSHYDIAPSLSAFLENNYNYTIPKNTHYLGDALDTSLQFHCKKMQAFMLNNREVVEWMHDTLFLSKNELYVIQSDLRLNLLENQEHKKRMQEELQMYQKLSLYAVGNNYLLKTGTNAMSQLDSLVIFPKKYRYESILIDSSEWSRIDEKSDFIHLVSPFKVSGSNMQCEISFNIQSLDTTASLPMILYQNEHGYVFATIPMTAIDGGNINTGKVETCKNKVVIPLDSKETEWQIYLRTKNKSQLLIQNIDVSIFVEK